MTTENPKSNSAKLQPAGKKPQTLVMKFGGTSVGTPEAMAQAVRIVRECHEQWPRVIVVTSALSTVTNLLLDNATGAARGEVQTFYKAEARLRTLHHAIADGLISDLARRAQVRQDINHLIAEFINLFQAISVLGEATPRALDAVASLGERMSVRLLAAALEDIGRPAQFVEANHLIITDDCFQNAHPNFADTEKHTRQFLEPILAQNRIPIITGFLGGTPEGITTTLGRGGSDYSAGILGAVLPADEVWIWTDVDGVMSADPRLVTSARTIPQLTYREISELAYFGAKVLHPKTIRPVVEKGVSLRICNTFNPEHPGTHLVADQDLSVDGEIKAVTAIKDQRLITVEGRGMLGVPGVAARTFQAVASTGTSVPLITQASSEQSICFAVPVESTARVLSALEKTFASELINRDIDRIWASEEVVIVTVVGAGMQRTPGVAGRIFSALGQKKANVIAIAQGSSEVSVSLVVAAADAESAVCAIHELIVP